RPRRRHARARQPWEYGAGLSPAPARPQRSRSAPSRHAASWPSPSMSVPAMIAMTSSGAHHEGVDLFQPRAAQAFEKMVALIAPPANAVGENGRGQRPGGGGAAARGAA